MQMSDGKQYTEDAPKVELSHCQFNFIINNLKTSNALQN